jgi:RNA polymerase sigma-70 factor (ECF subfamily)
MSIDSTTAAEIIRACLETGAESAWVRFVQAFQPLIASSVSRVAGRYGVPNRALVDDLTQETFLKICKENGRVLREFEVRHEKAIFGYIKVIATSVAMDHFRTRSTQKRSGEVSDGEEHSGSRAAPDRIEQQTFLTELDRHLAATESDRDRSIFWLYYRQGYSAREIAAMPHLSLTQKGVESCIYRLTQLLRDALKDAGPGTERSTKGIQAPAALGDME